MEPNPYTLIADFWGEDLTAELATRILDAPSDHLETFTEFWQERTRLETTEFPELSPGHLRPVLRPTLDDSTLIGRDPLGDSFRANQLAPSILLYAHEIVLQDVSPLLISPDPADRENVIRWLLTVYPLHRQGCLIFRSLADQRLWGHPLAMPDYQISKAAENLDFGLSEEDKVDPPESERAGFEMWRKKIYPRLFPTRSAREYVEHWTQLQTPLIVSEWEDYRWNTKDDGSRVETDLTPEDVAFLQVAYTVLLDATEFVEEPGWGDRSHHLFRNRAQAEVFETIIDKIALLDHRDIALTTLAILAVPSFLTHVGTLTSVRTQSDAFAEWRGELATALGRLTLVEAHDPSSVQQTRNRLREELLPLTEGLAKETRKSAALSAIADGTKNFGVALVSGLAGYAVGESIKTAATTAAAGEVAETIRSYKTERKRQKRRAEIAELVLGLTSS